MSESGMNTFIGHYILKLKAFFVSKNALSFLLFLAISFSFWFINMLDKERHKTLVIPLRYSGLPQNYDISKSNVDFITVEIKDKGINLFDYSKNKLNALTIDVNANLKNRGTIVFTNDELRAKLLKHLLPTTSIVELRLDSLVLVYEQLAKKKLPVKFNGKIETAQQYILSEDILLEPDTIIAYGSKRLLDQLEYIKTNWTEFKDLNKNVETSLVLQKVQGARFSTNDVKFSIYTEMFTEKELVFPVQVKNCPYDLIVRTFPAQVKLTFNVALSHFKSVSLNDIAVDVDFQHLLKNNEGKQKLNIKSRASYISNIRSEFEEVEYVIERK